MNRQGVDRSAITVVDLTDQDADNQFWWSKSPSERMEALETMRQIAYGYDPLTARIPRILEVDDRASG